MHNTTDDRRNPLREVTLQPSGDGQSDNEGILGSRLSQPLPPVLAEQMRPPFTSGGLRATGRRSVVRKSHCPPVDDGAVRHVPRSRCRHARREAASPPPRLVLGRRVLDVAADGYRWSNGCERNRSCCRGSYQRPVAVNLPATHIQDDSRSHHSRTPAPPDRRHCARVSRAA